MNETIEKILYGKCPNTSYHREDTESFFTYVKTRNEVLIYECGRCQEELSLINILKKNDYTIRTNKNLNRGFKK